MGLCRYTGDYCNDKQCSNLWRIIPALRANRQGDTTVDHVTITWKAFKNYTSMKIIVIVLALAASLVSCVGARNEGITGITGAMKAI